MGFLPRLKASCGVRARKKPKMYATVDGLLRSGKCGDYATSYSGLNLIGKGPNGRLHIVPGPAEASPSKSSAAPVPSALPTRAGSAATPCGVNPEECKDRPIRGAIFDADDTLWTVNRGIVSGCKGPWKRVSEDEVHSKNGCKVALLPTSRDTLTTLKQAGVILGVASINDRAPVVEALQALDLVPDLIKERDVHADWGSKDRMAQKLVRAWHVRPDEVSFMDDGLDNVMHVYNAFPGEGKPLSLVIAHRGGSYDVREPHDLLRYARVEGA